MFFVGFKMFQVLDFMVAFSVASLPTSFLKVKEKLKYLARQAFSQCNPIPRGQIAFAAWLHEREVDPSVL